MPDSFLALSGDVIAFAWSAPMRDLATRIGISDVALRKLLGSHGIVTPPQGHWNRVHAGRKVAGPPAPGPRRPGESGRVRLDARFRGHVPEASPMAEEGPFASERVPEALDDLRLQVLASTGRTPAPRDLARPHVGLGKLLARERTRREKAAASRWSWDEPYLDHPVGQRQLRLLSGLFRALDPLEVACEAWIDRGEPRADCQVGDQRIPLVFALAGEKEIPRRGQPPAWKDLPARTPLQLAISSGYSSDATHRWLDAGAEPLEKQLARIAADIVVAGEARFRRRLVEARLERERRQREEDERRAAEKARRDAERMALLEQSGTLLRQAEDLRALVARVELAVAGGALPLAGGELEAWRSWALDRVDALDPVLSGQVLKHLRWTADE